jgi:hypothetical protein
MQKQSILFVYVNFSSFVKADFEILSIFANVTKYQFEPGKGLFRTGFKLLKQFLFLLTNIWNYDSVFVWFADYHSLLPVLMAKILGKKSFVVIGGYDICRDRSLNYGAFCSSFRGFFSAQTIRHCSVNLTVSKYVDRKVKFVFRKVKHAMIYNCIHIDSPDKPQCTKENLILCVALIESHRTYLRKGADTFLALSSVLPDYKLVLIGPNKSGLLLFPNPLPNNVQVFERLHHNELVSYFQKASFYCQLSRIEIFGVAIGEAMLNRCIPLVTNEGGMPEVVGNEGVIVPREIGKIAASIREIEGRENSARRDECRQRILTRFSVAQRQEKLFAMVSQS